MSRPANHTPTWKNWLLLAVGLWAFLLPSWALVPGNPTPGSKNRVWDFFSKTGISCLANPLASLALASGKVACGYENRVDPNCCGEQWDQDLGLYYNRARYLNTDSGRFWSQDEYEGRNADPASLHKYLYANANPVRFLDPSGQFSLSEVMAVARVVGTLSNLVVVSLYLYTKVADTGPGLACWSRCMDRKMNVFIEGALVMLELTASVGKTSLGSEPLPGASALTSFVRHLSISGIARPYTTMIANWFKYTKIAGISRVAVANTAYYAVSGYVAYSAVSWGFSCKRNSNCY